MSRVVIALPGVLLSALLMFPLAGLAASSNLVIQPCDAGAHYLFAEVECAIPLENVGDTPITVSQGEARWPFDHIEQDEIVVPPHGSTVIKATISLHDWVGPATHDFRFHSSEAGQHVRGSSIYGFGLSVLDEPDPKFAFGEVRMDEALPSKTVKLSSREVAGFRVEKVLSHPDWLKVSVDETGTAVTATVLPSAPWGPVEAKYVKLAINSDKQPQVWVDVEFTGIGEVAAGTNPFSLGLMRTGEDKTRLIRITNRAGKALKLGKLRVEGIEASAEAQPCIPAKDSCRLINLEVSDKQRLGQVHGWLYIELPERDRELPVRLNGMLLAKETKIHQWEDLVAKSGNAKSGLTTEKKVDFGEALQEMTYKEPPPPPGEGPLLSWSVAHQARIYGYVIYRAPAEDGPFLRINDHIILKHERGEDRSGKYQWRDVTAKPGETYWYIVGLIFTDGTKKDLTGAQKVVAKKDNAEKSKAE